MHSHLREQIDAGGGWLSFERFMDAALYAPGLGYYSAGARKLGAGGDFTTGVGKLPAAGLFGFPQAVGTPPTCAAAGPSRSPVG